MEIKENGTIKQRVTQLVAHLANGNKAAFGRVANIQSGVLAGILGGRENKPSFDILQRLLAGYPTVSPDWLLFGTGTMLRQDARLGKDVPAGSIKARILYPVHFIDEQLKERDSYCMVVTRNLPVQLRKGDVIVDDVDDGFVVIESAFLDTRQAEYTVIIAGQRICNKRQFEEIKEALLGKGWQAREKLAA